MTAGVMLGLGVVAGWLATTWLVDEFAHPTPPQSLTFVSPVARALFGLLLEPASLAEFGAGSVFGVALGAFAAARRADEFRWEAFDDPREMKRHLLGAVFMGSGGILCGGCTIGQGLTAGSLFALSWPLAVAGMAVGARLGIALLMEVLSLASCARAWPAASTSATNPDGAARTSRSAGRMRSPPSTPRRPKRGCTAPPRPASPRSA